MTGLVWPYLAPRAVRALYHAFGFAEWLAKPLKTAKTRAHIQIRTTKGRPGVTILIPERGNAPLLEECLKSVQAARAEIAEPSQVIVIASGASEPRYRHLMTRKADVHWLFFSTPLFFGAAVRQGLKRAEHDWIYLLNSDMVLDPLALRAVLRWRDRSIFAIASQIFFRDPTKRREETGWTAFRQKGLGPIEILDVPPEDQNTVRGTLYAGGGASLFQKKPLGKLMHGSRVYAPFYWEDVEWGVRAWQSGYQVLFCPESKVWHEHRATNRKFFSEDEIERIMTRNRVFFYLRNQTRPACFEEFKKELSILEERSIRELFHPVRLFHILAGHMSGRALPYRDLPLQHTWAKYYSKPRTQGKPLVLIVSPYIIYPPAHGGARRIAGLLKALERHFDLVLLSDEGESYGQPSQKYYRDLVSVHLVGGRAALPPNESGRIVRIDNHSHPLLAEHLRFLVSTYQPAVVQVEYGELSRLISVRDGDQSRWFLTLHDVNFSENRGSSPEDIYERKWMEPFDGLITCSREDADLLRSHRAVVIPNGADIPVKPYLPSPSGGPILFMGPFRYSPNLRGIRAFLERAYRPLLERIPGLELWILAGDGASAAVSQVAAFRQPGVKLLDYTEHPDQFLDQCAITINPLTGVRGSCLKVIESVAAGRVCVSTQEGARGFSESGFTSLICEERVEDFVIPIQQLLLDDEYRRRLEQPDPNLLESLSWNHSGQLQAQFYERCTTTAPNASKRGF